MEMILELIIDLAGFNEECSSIVEISPQNTLE